MKVINSDSRYDIFSNDINTMDKLPAGAYEIVISNFGKYLNKINDIQAKESKIYGTHENKCDMILKSFSKSDRSLGVIFSGTKGSGKSLLMRLICEKSGMPVIVLRQYFNGLVQFLDSIEQECVVIFDEFDKNFPDVASDEGDRGSVQEMLLPLFDGLSSQKRLFIITCNDVYKLNENYINRPGRFHYHIIFDSPTLDEAIEYLTDNVDEKYAANIEDIRNIYHKYKFTYDILRAFAFELNMGKKISDFISDININCTHEKTACEVSVILTSGEVITNTQYIVLSLMSPYCLNSKGIRVDNGKYWFDLDLDDFVYNITDGLYHINDPKNIVAEIDENKVSSSIIKDATIRVLNFSGIDEKDRRSTFTYYHDY